MATTAQTIINRALRLLGTIASGESPTSQESDDALVSLNGLITAWQANKEMTVVTLTTYATLATSQNLPNGYDDALAYNLAARIAAEYQKEIPAYVVEVAKVTLDYIKRDTSVTASTSASTIITKAIRLCGGVRNGEAPTAKELEYGLSTLNSVIGVWLANRDMKVVTLTTYANAATTQTLPSGYDQALTYALAVALSPQYGGQAFDALQKLADYYYNFVRRDAAPAVDGTAVRIINRALRLIGHLRPDENSTSTEQAYGLLALNSMIESWQLDRLTVAAYTDTALTLTPGDGSYTVGPSANFNITPRPPKLENIFARDAEIDYPIQLVTQERWFAIPDKTVESDIPDMAYYEPSYANGVLQIWPVPSKAISLHIVTWGVISSFAATSTSITLPQGYERALTYNLAMDIAPEYQKQVPAEVARVAAESLAALKRANQRPIDAYTELYPLLGGGAKSDIYSGGYV